MRVCHLNTCPVGIATHREDLRKKFTGKPEHVVSFFQFVAQEMREIMAELGFRTVSEMIGRADVLESDPDVRHWKLPRGLDMTAILHLPEAGAQVARRNVCGQQHGLERALDHQLIEMCEPAIERMEPVERHIQIRNVNRTVGTMLGHVVSKKHGLEGLPDNTIRLRFRGTAGQSFGAFLPHGITMTLEGDANDHIGKGLSGGRLIVHPPREATFDPAQNIVVGNVALYGATSGEAFFNGIAGERFCVRNSGAHAVVEGVGDHGCEYMTGGRVVVLGRTGRNFGAGMCGGIAYVLDLDGEFAGRCNPERVELETLDAEDVAIVQRLVRRHFQYTRSRRADEVLRKWDDMAPRFVKVFPKDLKLALEARLAAKSGDG